MGYMTIEHLYKCPDFFKIDSEIVYMEKIHGTSTWINMNITEEGVNMNYHPGGETSKTFDALFDKPFIENELKSILDENKLVGIRIHGEAYGGKQQKMMATYGNVLKFIVFDVKIYSTAKDSIFLNLKDAVAITNRLKLEFVPYVIGPNTPEFAQIQTDLPSVQAERNGMGNDKLREGIVVKPVNEIKIKGNNRAICKHKCGPFWETKRPGTLKFGESTAETEKLLDKLNIVISNNEMAENWITSMRADHVLDKMLHSKIDDKKFIDLADIGVFVSAMIDDVKKESEGEIKWSNDLISRMRSEAGNLLKRKVLENPEYLWSKDLINKFANR